MRFVVHSLLKGLLELELAGAFRGLWSYTRGLWRCSKLQLGN